MKFVVLLFALALSASVAAKEAVFHEDGYRVTVDLSKLRTYQLKDGDTVYGAMAVMQKDGVHPVALRYNISGEYCAKGGPKMVWLTEPTDDVVFATAASVNPDDNANKLFDAICAVIGKVPTYAAKQERI